MKMTLHKLAEEPVFIFGLTTKECVFIIVSTSTLYSVTCVLLTLMKDMGSYAIFFMSIGYLVIALPMMFVFRIVLLNLKRNMPPNFMGQLLHRLLNKRPYSGLWSGIKR